MKENRKMVLWCAVVLTLLIGGCLGSADRSEMSPGLRVSDQYAVPTPTAAVVDAADSGGGVGGGVAEKYMVPPGGKISQDASPDYSVKRKIIMTGSLNVQVDNFQAASDAVESIAKRYGGFISDSYSYVTGSGKMRGTITIRVPQKDFYTAIKDLEGIGTVKSKRTSGQDVSEEYIDLEARLNNYKKEEERYLAILDRANTVEDLLKVEQQLSRVRGEIERLEGRIRYLDNRIELSTITVEMYEVEPITQSWGIRDTLRQALGGFISSVKGIIVFTGSALPWAVFILVIYFIIRQVRKKKNVDGRTG